MPICLRKSYISTITVTQNHVSKTKGRVIIGNFSVICALGRSGITRRKREGDGTTPAGIFRLHRLWWRDDKHVYPSTGLKTRRIRERDGWCDDLGSSRYNKPVILPFARSHEQMQRGDHLYDYVIEIGWNMAPIKRGRGSAIFLHLARAGFEPTAGCVAVAPDKIRRLLARIGPRTRIRIG